jgi:hypothetical protein
MFYDEHNPPHFHAEYGEYKAMFDFEGDLIKGEFPNKQTKIVAAWAVLNKENLVANWIIGQNGGQVRDIPSLFI